MSIVDKDSQCLMEGVYLSKTHDHVHVHCDASHRVVSSAVLNGGFTRATDFLNLKVERQAESGVEDPAVTLQAACDKLGCKDVTVGMMTAASMKSLRLCREDIQGRQFAVLVTTGLENARRSGDRAEYRHLHAVPLERGTINLCMITDARVLDHAMIEMITIATEAKVAILHELNIVSPVSGGLATGTGTDAVAVFSGNTGDPISFAGKHTLLGERLAIMVMQIIRESIAYQEEAGSCA
jgi:adenosylcobinamide amidohydrolase